MLEYEDLYNVVLIGHSYAGMVISGVAEKVANRLSHLVYFDAYLPENKKSINDYLKVPSLAEIVAKKGDGWKIPLLGKIEDLGVTDKEDIEWATARIGYQPYKTFTDTISLKMPSNTIAKTFIRLSNFSWFTAIAEKALKQGFNYYEMLAGGHDAMISRPEETAEILLKIK
jgi:pimeloyl-ACP methyl ester carboxylesterase